MMNRSIEFGRASRPRSRVTISESVERAQGVAYEMLSDG
jgi:hypothetical protein